ncbi:uncharacterized protein LOC113280814 [Papaver somniferum]|uniref:uncharacterized protein LOC113280814 n=1 Tax=Papaver somniferum TaxID=3469 RepID=UPI000E6F994B|nr:uncharacterized protein LOC113280814 [Papaver somniferum]
MTKIKDKFWEYAEKLNNRFKCKYCKRDFPGGVARVKSHLSGIKGRDIAVCAQVPEEVQASAVIAVGEAGVNVSGTKRAKSSSGSVGESIVSVCEEPRLQQTSIPAMLSKKDKDAVDMKVALCFFLNNIAFNVIQTTGFIEMIKAVSEYGIGYSLPSYSTLRTKLVVNTKADVERYVNEVKESWSLTGCTIMSDIWTDMKKRSFINVIAYSPKGAVFLKSVERSGESNTGLFIREVLLPVIEEIGAENVVQIVTDNASNYGLACNLIMEEYPHIIKSKCAAHGVQLLFEDIYDSVDWVKDIFLKARKIYDHFYRHIILLDLMREHTKKDLRKYSKTRFASHFLMLQSILDVEDGLRNLVASVEYRNMLYSKRAVADIVKELIQGTPFWEDGKELISAMEPLVKVLRLVDGDGSTSGYIYEATDRARKAIKKRCEEDPVKYMHIWELFEFRVKSNLLHEVHAAAMYLNPPFMFDGKISYTNEAVQAALSYIYDKLIDTTERTKFSQELLLYNGKHPKIFTSISIDQISNCHPRVWWEANGGSVPILRKVAIRLLSQPCSASACERNWSSFDAAQTKKRNRLAPQMLEDLVYIRMNSLMLKNSVNFELKDRDPINLENLAEWDTELVDGNLDEAIDEGFVADAQSDLNVAWMDRMCSSIGTSSRMNYRHQ